MSITPKSNIQPQSTGTNDPLSMYESALREAYQKRPTWKKVSALLESAHAAGDARATYALATWYMYGVHGYRKDIKMGIKLCKLAAMKNISSAHYHLAICYWNGYDVKKNYRLAYLHFVGAALNGDDESYEAVAFCLYYGIGVRRDRALASIWMDKAEDIARQDG